MFIIKRVDVWFYSTKNLCYNTSYLSLASDCVRSHYTLSPVGGAFHSFQDPGSMLSRFPPSGSILSTSWNTSVSLHSQFQYWEARTRCSLLPEWNAQFFWKSAITNKSFIHSAPVIFQPKLGLFSQTFKSVSEEFFPPNWPNWLSNTCAGCRMPCL